MFNQAASFNRPLADWDVSSVTNMHSMFNGAASFNQPLGNWNVTSATSMELMFDLTGCPGTQGEESCFYI
jgi:surface protein